MAMMKIDKEKLDKFLTFFVDITDFGCCYCPAKEFCTNSEEEECSTIVKLWLRNKEG